MHLFSLDYACPVLFKEFSKTAFCKSSHKYLKKAFLTFPLCSVRVICRFLKSPEIFSYMQTLESDLAFTKGIF